MSDFNFIASDNNDDISSINTGIIPADEERMLNRRYLPVTINNRAASPVKMGSTTVTSSLTLNVGTNATFGMRLLAVPANMNFVSMEYSIYIGSTSDPVANLLPGGTSTSGNDWEMFGPIDAPYGFDTGALDGTGNFSSWLGLSHLAGVNAVVTIVRTYRYIINDGGIL